ncbi:DDE_Tnp_1_7 domain-containing protein [Trichonephila clavipes]|nr:DDE_Tnp_1_7 domain-containing protein [Trichonephila clavipes]
MFFFLLLFWPVFKGKSDPTSYEKRNIVNGYLISSYGYLPMLPYIKQCTAEDAHGQLGKNKWSTTLDQLDAFISILYARGIYGANNLDFHSLWSVAWGPPFSAILWREIDSETYEFSVIQQICYVIWTPLKR